MVHRRRAAFALFPFHTALIAAWLLFSPQASSRVDGAEEPPKGEVLQFSFEGSRVFPGTVRDYWVYVPAQYDGRTPACVHVNQDGIQFNAPQVFDRLIHEERMPVTIGVFIMHGRVKATSTNALDRFNRSF